MCKMSHSKPFKDINFLSYIQSHLDQQYLGGRYYMYYLICMCLLTEAWFLFLTTSRWFAVRLDGICSVFVTITAFGCLYLRDGTVWINTLLTSETMMMNSWRCDCMYTFYLILQDWNQVQWVWLYLMQWHSQACSSGASDRAQRSRTWWEHWIWTAVYILSL